MKAIMVMFDTLSRRLLPPYGCDWVHAPNFARLAERTVAFENAFIGSAPCMPARRELHTGRVNFLHRSWGPIEPFDDSMPEILKRAGIYTHLATDHYHYWEDGGATYHPRYSSFEVARGQESDYWNPEVADPPEPEHLGQIRRANLINRKYITEEADYPQAVTFAAGLRFLDINHDQDNWFLQIEAFDPHEPYLSPRKYKDLYRHKYNGPLFDWPKYHPVDETPEQVEHCRLEHAALISMCDAHLGKVLDAMDRHDLWKDTLLIVNTDHGFLLGEHDWWGKCSMPFFNEVAHIPLFIWDPRCGCAGQRRKALVQTIDLPATLLEFFGVPRPADMQGVPLKETLTTDAPVREAALFGIFGGHVNVTDGRYVYMRAPATEENQPLFQHTLMPTLMRGLFPPEDFAAVTLREPFNFTKGCKVMRIVAPRSNRAHGFGTLLFDNAADYAQKHPVKDPAVEQRMIKHLIREMKANDAPADQYERLGLPAPA
jgi:arylsulfatase A-like enzyme